MRVEMKHLREKSAFPITSGSLIEEGMSKRFYAACHAMQGLLARSQKDFQGNNNLPVPYLVAGFSFEYADELLKQEYESSD
jgi:hypothetical protein